MPGGATADIAAQRRMGGWIDGCVWCGDGGTVGRSAGRSVGQGMPRPVGAQASARVYEGERAGGAPACPDRLGAARGTGRTRWEQRRKKEGRRSLAKYFTSKTPAKVME